jgi:predicted lipoprotein with Yx(FWY)xxD motif
MRTSRPLRTIPVTLALLLVIAACSPAADSGGGTTTTEAPTATTGPDNATTTTLAGSTTSSTAGGETPGVTVASSSIGQILVDPNGLTLYVFTQDTDGESTCYDACASSWPHVPADTPIGSGVDPALFGSTTRTDGTEQLTIDGQPLYFFAGDQEPGDLLGQGLNDVWFAVGGDGVANEAKAGQSPLDGDDGYDY